jgi:hypothetical protein
MQIPVTEVQRLKLEPGETLVVRCGTEPSNAEVAFIQEQMRAIVGEHVPVLVLGPDMTLEVVSPS